MTFFDYLWLVLGIASGAFALFWLVTIVRYSSFAWIAVIRALLFAGSAVLAYFLIDLSGVFA